MGLLDRWRASEKAETEGEKKVAIVPLKDLLSKDDLKSRLFADIMRRDAESGDVSAESALKNLLDKKSDPADLPTLIKYHGELMGHLERVSKVRAFLTDETIKTLGEYSDKFRSLNALFGSEAAAKPHWDDQLLYLAIHVPTTFDDIALSASRYIDARKRSKKVATQVIARELLPSVKLESLADKEDKKERLTFLREKITAERFGGWRQTIDRYLGGFLSRISARVTDRRIASVLNTERAAIKRDQQTIATFLEQSVDTDPEVQRAFVGAATGRPVPEKESFPKLYEVLKFQELMKNAWDNGGKPPAFNARNVARANTDRQTFFNTWKTNYERQINSGPLNAFWKPVAVGFLNSYATRPNLSILV